MASAPSLDETLVNYRDVMSIAERGALPLLLETFLYALYMVLMFYLLYRRRVDRKTTPRLPAFMLIVTLAMFALFSLYWAVDVYLLWAAVYRYLPRQSTIREDTFLDGIWISWSAPYFLQQISLFGMIVLGDIISLWRAYVIYNRRQWLFILSIGIGVVESGLYILILVEYLAEELPHFARGFYDFSESSNTAAIMAAGLVTGCAQIFATSLITYRAWVYWRDVREFSRQNQVRHGIAMLVVVIETGVVYLALLFWYGAVVIFAGYASLAVTLVFYYATPLIAMYPPLVVVLVATRRSILERSIDAKTAILSSNVRFATNAGTQEERSRTYSPHLSSHSADDSELRQGGTRWLEVSFGPSIELDSPASIRDSEGASRSDGQSVTLEKPRRALLTSSSVVSF
ncbi:hypothetical protein PENSPDRAFT_687115 [Peniophora sp. CONT]|nr:hypothetical protein PENSPDRAFT_687115 [Peniophora sp. CONT]